MSDADTKSSIKTIAIRLESALHAQLSVIAQLRDRTITDEIREALDNHVQQVKAEGDLTDKAGAALEEVDREAASRREAIAALLGETPKGRRTTRSEVSKTD
jgi:predicted transcriptional regulator